ncbi:hypothetical protein [Rufibacter roseus]
MRDLLLKRGVKTINLTYRVHQDGEHKGWFWQREFGQVISWLFGK